MHNNILYFAVAALLAAGCVSTNTQVANVQNEMIITSESDESDIICGKSYYKKVYTAPAIPAQPAQPTTYVQPSGDVLTASKGVNYGPSGKETYYNLNMSGVIDIAKSQGIEGEYWVREDGVKMYGDYVIVAANLDTHPRGSTVETSLGTGIVLDTGGFAASDPTQVDIATDW